MKRLYLALLAVAPVFAISNAALAQTPRPTPAQAQAAMTDPAIRARILAQVRASGMSPDQIRAQLRSMGYSDEVINQLIGAVADTSAALSEDVFAAVRALGIMDSTAVDSLHTPFVQRRIARATADSILLDSLAVALQNDSLRAAVLRLLSSPAARRVGMDSGFALFGRDVFDRRTKQFDPSVSGPLPPDYRIGYGDTFTLVLTGDVERTEELAVTRGGWVVLRDVGQVPAANLTFAQLYSTLGARLARVYSGVGNGTTRFSILPTEVGTNQVYVLGDVQAPNAYQISRLGTVLTALYAAGGPSENGDARTIEVKRNNRVIATMDLYDYLLSGSSSSDVRLENGDVIFVRPQGPRVRVAGAVVRPATYELRPGESLADAIRMAGGFLPQADRRRVQIERIVPADERGDSGKDKEVIDITSPLLATGFGPTTQKMEAGDVVRVFRVAPVVSNRIQIEGNVYQPAAVAYEPGMRLSGVIARAGGLKPDTYLGHLLISRLEPDSTRQLLRVSLNPDGSPSNDMAMAPNDVVRIFSTTEFRTDRYVTVGGAVNAPKQIPFQEGMTMRDAIMLAGGLEESALLTEAEIGRLPADRSHGVTATTMRVPLDSTYLFERGPDGKYLGPPGIPAPVQRAPEVLLKPYDAIAILRQPEFDYQSTVSIVGRVKYAATYSLTTKTERLLDLIRRAGGLASDADSSGIIFIRQRDSIGRVGVDLPAVLRNENHVDNLVLVDGDSIVIPAYTAVVMVKGEVNSLAAAVAYVEGADIDYYIRSAGGGTPKADIDRAYVQQPTGKIEARHRTAFVFRSDPEPQAGSIVYVPEGDGPQERNWVAMAQTGLSLLGSLITIAVLIRQQ